LAASRSISCSSENPKSNLRASVLSMGILRLETAQIHVSGTIKAFRRASGGNVAMKLRKREPHVVFFCVVLSLCHSERSEESRIFYDACRRTLNHGAITFIHRCPVQKDTGFFAALRMTQKKNFARDDTRRRQDNEKRLVGQSSGLTISFPRSMLGRLSIGAGRFGRLAS
jgi:hypothetical protein